MGNPLISQLHIVRERVSRLRDVGRITPSCGPVEELLFAHPGRAWFWQNDPLFRVRYRYA